MSEVRSHRDLTVWQKSMALAAECYRLSAIMPKVEQYRLTSQLLRAAASVPANIAEGHVRGSRKEYAHFIAIARGSLAETETFLELAVTVRILEDEQAQLALGFCYEVGKMLGALHGRLRSPPDP